MLDANSLPVFKKIFWHNYRKPIAESTINSSHQRSSCYMMFQTSTIAQLHMQHYRLSTASASPAHSRGRIVALLAITIYTLRRATLAWPPSRMTVYHDWSWLPCLSLPTSRVPLAGQLVGRGCPACAVQNAHAAYEIPNEMLIASTTIKRHTEKTPHWSHNCRHSCLVVKPCPDRPDSVWVLYNLFTKTIFTLRAVPRASCQPAPRKRVGMRHLL